MRSASSSPPSLHPASTKNSDRLCSGNWLYTQIREEMIRRVQQITNTQGLCLALKQVLQFIGTAHLFRVHSFCITVDVLRLLSFCELIVGMDGLLVKKGCRHIAALKRGHRFTEGFVVPSVVGSALVGEQFRVVHQHMHTKFANFYDIRTSPLGSADRSDHVIDSFDDRGFRDTAMSALTVFHFCICQAVRESKGTRQNIRNACIHKHLTSQLVSGTKIACVGPDCYLLQVNRDGIIYGMCGGGRRGKAAAGSLP